MSAQENLRVATEATQAMQDGDMGAMDRTVADDVVWHVIGRAEPFRGKEALRQMEPGGGDYEITARSHDILASDDHAVVLVNATATRGGRTLDYRTAEIFHIRDGKIVERWAFSDDTARVADFFA
jgi:ketosteroid isomerase-like protein